MESKYKNTNVIELGYDDFKVKKNKIHVDHAKFKNKLGLIKFYAPWCPHCTDMVETLSYLSDQLQDYGFVVAAVNCDDTELRNDQLAQDIGIEGFPSLYFVNGQGELQEYQGGRDLENLLLEIVRLSKRET